MKKLTTACAAIAMLAVSSVSAVAEVPELPNKANSSIVTVSGTVMNEILSSEEGVQAESITAEKVICVIEILDDVYGKHLDKDGIASVQSIIGELEAIKDSSDSDLTEEEVQSLKLNLFSAVSVYAAVCNEVPVEQQLADIKQAVAKDSVKMSDCDLKSYMNELLSTDTSDMTEEELNLHGNALMMTLYLSRTGAPFTVGDVNTDNKINTIDALTVFRAGVKMKDLEAYEAYLGDTNGDGKITAFDAFLIQKHLAGYSVNFGKQ